MMPIGVLEWLLAKFSEVVKELIEEGDLTFMQTILKFCHCRDFTGIFFPQG